MSNELFQALSVLVAVLEASALAWALGRGDLTGVVVINGVCAAGVLLLNAAAVPTIVQTLDWNLLLLLAFELIALTTSLLWFVFWAPAWLVWAEFAVHVLISLAALIFAFTFKLDRLI